jgi:hypothetical protein
MPGTFPDPSGLLAISLNSRTGKKHLNSKKQEREVTLLEDVLSNAINSGMY